MCVPGSLKVFVAARRYDTIVAGLKEMYAAERAVAVYPCLRGPTGRPNEQGVLQPWLDVKDKCEP